MIKHVKSDLQIFLQEISDKMLICSLFSCPFVLFGSTPVRTELTYNNVCSLNVYIVGFEGSLFSECLSEEQTVDLNKYCSQLDQKRI